MGCSGVGDLDRQRAVIFRFCGHLSRCSNVRPEIFGTTHRSFAVFDVEVGVSKRPGGRPQTSIGLELQKNPTLCIQKTHVFGVSLEESGR